MKKISKSTKTVISALLIVMLLISLMPTYSSAKAKVKLNKTKATLYVGKTVTLKLKNNKKKIKWSTSNKKVATVSSKGKVNAKKKGKATITAKVGKKKYKCKITVKVQTNTPATYALTPQTTSTTKPTYVPSPTPSPTVKPTNTPIPTPTPVEAELELSEDGTTVLGVTNADKAMVINIPHTVTTIGKGAFYDCVYIRTLKIPSSVTTIEMGALPSGLTSLYIPSNVTLIHDQNIPKTCIIYGEPGSYAHQWANDFGCTFILTIATNPTEKPIAQIESFSFEKEEIEIKHGKFSDVNLLGGSETNWDSINWECSNPDLIKEIRPVNVNFFYAPIARICVREGVTGTATITATVEAEVGVLVATCKIIVPVEEAQLHLVNDDTELFYIVNDERATVINIPDTVTKIWRGTFYNCHYIKTIKIPPSVTTIGENTLPHNNGYRGYKQYLESIYIPPSVTSIGSQDMPDTCIIYGEAGSYAEQWAKDRGNPFIATIPAPTPTPVEAELELSEDGTTVLGVTNADKAMVINIPHTVTTIKEFSLYYCRYIKTLEIPSSVTTIEKFVFPQKADLESIYIPSSVTFIGSQNISMYTCIIYGEAGSYAEKWAKDRGNQFIAR